MEHEANEQWYTLEDIELDNQKACEKLYCLAVDSPEKQFLIGEIGVPTHNTDEGKEEDSLKGEAQMILGSIARLGRAAGVHMVVATQRPDATIISGETKANLGVRIACGRTLGNASSMILDNGEGNRIRSTPKGRLYVKIFGEGDHAQGFFQTQEWIDEWLAKKGFNPDGSPLGTHQSKLAKITDMNEFEGATLDEREGVDNSAIIERIREEEAQNLLEESDWDFDDDDLESVEGDLQEVTDSEPEPPSDRPVLTGGKKDSNPWDRPEDDWDRELEELIQDNFDE